MSSACVRRLVVGVALAASSIPACRADESVLDAIYRCDPEAGDAQCGTDENGRPMTCYLGSAQLGGKAFCTKTCDPGGGDEPGFHCTSSGALLKTCDPGADENSCPTPLNCYRTDVIFDEGLCMWVPVCPFAENRRQLDSAQCGFSHQDCAGDLLRELVAGTTFETAIRTNNLHCVAKCNQEDCPTTGLPEQCPLDFYAPVQHLPVTCGAICDEVSCPPNYSCARHSSPDAPSVCLPGVLGMRCTSDDDCMAGGCVDTGAGFSACTFPDGCSSDDDCLMFGADLALVCLDGLPEEEGAQCVSSIPFNGANCQDSSDCAAELSCGSELCPPRDCSWYSPHELEPKHGNCRFECDPDEGGCPSFGGFPHVCLEGVVPDELGELFGGCFPGTWGIPCKTSRDCFANLTCAAVPPDERSRSQYPEICTAPCGDAEHPEDPGDADCVANPWLGNGYCVPVSDPVPGTLGYCRPGARTDRPCEKDSHCASAVCLEQEDGTPSRCQ